MYIRLIVRKGYGSFLEIFEKTGGASLAIAGLLEDIRLVLSKELTFSMFGLSVLQGIVFCFIPAMIASKIRPTEAIRWE